MSVEKKINYDVQGGIRNYLGKQKTVSDVPLKWKSGPSHPETELAYITKAEKKLLIKKDLHKSLKNGPNKGPGGIMSLNNDGIGDLGGPGNVSAGGGAKNEGRELGAMANQTQSTPDTTAAPPGTRHNPNTVDGYSDTSTPDTTTTPDTTPNFSIHDGPTFTGPPRVPNQIGFSTFGTVPGVDYRYVGPDSQFAKNTSLTNNFPEYSFNSKIPSINFIGNTLGKFTYNTNTNFFKKNSIGGKINPATGQPFGYGIDGYRDYMKQRQLGNVGAYGGTELSQNAINARAGDGDGGGGIMDVTVNETTNDTTDDTTTNEDGSLILRFLHDNPQEVVNLQAMGVADTDEMLQVMLERAKNLYT